MKRLFCRNSFSFIQVTRLEHGNRGSHSAAAHSHTGTYLINEQPVSGPVCLGTGLENRRLAAFLAMGTNEVHVARLSGISFTLPVGGKKPPKFPTKEARKTVKTYKWQLHEQCVRLTNGGVCVT